MILETLTLFVLFAIPVWAGAWYFGVFIRPRHPNYRARWNQSIRALWMLALVAFVVGVWRLVAL